MEIYDNERDQLEALKRFFIEYGKSIAAIIILVIAAFAGWHYWNNNAEKTLQSNSLAYQTIITDLKTDKTPAVSTAEKFASDNKNTYGALAALALAQHFIDSKQPDKAASQLQQALTNSKDDNLNALIALRLARIQIQQKQPDAALQTLAHAKGENWLALVADLRGDALLSKGDTQGARTAWSEALKSAAPVVLRNLVQMKIDNLPA